MMSSRKQSFFDKTRVFYHALKRYYKKSGTLVVCSFCHSYNISFVKGEEHGNDDGRTIEYKGIYQCRDCGATCTHTQSWIKPKGELD